MIAIYKADVHHNNRELLGLADNKHIAYYLVGVQAEKEGERISEDDAHNLKHIQQTQNYAGEGEFVIEEIPLNELI